ncbi:hypothetical protein [Lysinibacillus piscis]|uniref:DUF4276 family protein n=1 Tax=Lysinibacillus piscis TaxID=2518931 RepID=A0ABQ5NK13_9BACI|nr:hypothetical protein [Lysinibacillus sp. KH24]GLC88416.1 hypothetical protein LYSBPC_15430 [Lysinibacillus sp. KH24]
MANMEKKVVLVLVEGNTDETLLIGRLRELFKEKEIRFEPKNGDIFYDMEQAKKPVKELIGNRVKEILLKRKFKPSNILAVLHILDTDGCFIESDAILVNNEQATLTEYQENGIYVQTEAQKHNIQQRNEVRSRNIQIMNTTQKILTYSYQAYYFSRHLEHVVFNDMNPKKENKVEKVDRFLDELEVPIEEFLEAFLPQERTATYEDTYKNSWQFVSQDLNSLKRATNIPLMLDFLQEQVPL